MNFDTKRIRHKPRPLRTVDSVRQSEQQPVRQFDPERDMPSEMLESLQERAMDATNIRSFAMYGSTFLLLCPDRNNELDANIRCALTEKKSPLHSAYVKLLDSFGTKKTDDTAVKGNADAVAQLVIISPEFRPKDYVVWDAVKPSVDRLADTTDVLGLEDLVDFCSDLAVIYPERRKELPLNVETWRKCQKHLQSMRDRWEDYALFASRLALVYPEYVEGLGLDQEAWDGMKNDLSLQTRLDVDYCHTASAMHILASGRPEVTKDGIRFTPLSRAMKRPQLVPDRPHV